MCESRDRPIADRRGGPPASCRPVGSFPTSSRVAPASLPLIAAVEEIAATRRTQADRMIELWQTHAGDRAALVRALAHPGLAG